MIGSQNVRPRAAERHRGFESALVAVRNGVPGQDEWYQDGDRQNDEQQHKARGSLGTHPEIAQQPPSQAAPCSGWPTASSTKDNIRPVHGKGAQIHGAMIPEFAADVAVKLMTLAAISCGSTEDPRFHCTPRQYGRIKQAH